VHFLNVFLRETNLTFYKDVALHTQCDAISLILLLVVEHIEHQYTNTNTESVLVLVYW